MSHVIYLLSPREKGSESEPDWSPRTQSTSTYAAIVRVWRISSLVRAIFIEKHLTLRGACLMNARRCRSSSRWGYNFAHKCGCRTRICKVRLRRACLYSHLAGLLWSVTLVSKLPSSLHPVWRSYSFLLQGNTLEGFSYCWRLFATFLPDCGSANQELFLRPMWHHLYWPCVIYWWLWNWNSPCHRRAVRSHLFAATRRFELVADYWLCWITHLEFWMIVELETNDTSLD